VKHDLGFDLMPRLRLVFGQIAAACSNLAIALRDGKDPSDVRLQVTCLSIQDPCFRRPASTLVYKPARNLLMRGWAWGLCGPTAWIGRFEPRSGSGLRLRSSLTKMQCLFILFDDTLQAETPRVQAKGGKQMFGRSWGRLEAELARTLHETFGLVADRLPWDNAEDNLAFRHMPEARCCTAGQHAP